MEMPLETQPDGSVSFTLSQSGMLIFTPARQGESIVVSLSRPLNQNERTELLQVLQKAGYKVELGNNLHMALDRDENLYFSAMLSSSQVTTPTIERTVDYLIEAARLN